MKRMLLMTTCAIGISIPAFSQDKSKGELSLTFAKGANAIRKPQLEGGESFDGEGFYGFGLSYLKPLNNWLDIEAGIGYHRYKINHIVGHHPGGDRTTSSSNLGLISVPVSFRANFLRYFFVNAGAVADFETKHSMLDNQSGIGAMAGIGFKYAFTPKFSVFINPYLQQHAIIPFRPAEQQHRLLDAGVKLGVGLKL